MSRERKVDNYPQLLKEFREREPSHILIGGDRHPGTPGTIAPGGYGSFHHDILYIARFGKKQRNFREHLFVVKRQGQEAWAPEDVDPRNLSIGLVTLGVEIRRDMLREDLFDIQVDIADGETHEPIDPSKLANAHEKAIESGATEEVARLFL